MDVSNMSKSELDRLYRELDERIHEESQINVPSEYKYAQSFNRFRLRYPDHELERAVGYVFFTKPDLNIIDESGNPIGDNAGQIFTLRDILRSKDIILAQCLKQNIGGQFINPITNFADNMEVQDIQMKTRVSAETSINWKVQYGFRTTDSKASGTFSITYSDDRNLTIYKLHQIWVNYMNAVAMGHMSPKREYIAKRILDYAVSAYYFLVAEDGETIVYYAKYTGVFPTNVPDSAYSWQKGDESKERTFQIQYQYSFYDPMNPLIIKEFNKVTGGPKGKELPVFQASLGLMGPTWANNVAVVENHENGHFKNYKLKFYK